MTSQTAAWTRPHHASQKTVTPTATKMEKQGQKESPQPRGPQEEAEIHGMQGIPDVPFCMNKSGQVKRPMNPFLVWARIQRPIVSKANPWASTTQISTLLGMEWSKLTEEEKNPFYEKAHEIKMKHNKMFPEWEYKPRIAKKTKPAMGDEASGSSRTSVYQPQNILMYKPNPQHCPRTAKKTKTPLHDKPSTSRPPVYNTPANLMLKPNPGESGKHTSSSEGNIAQIADAPSLLSCPTTSNPPPTSPDPVSPPRSERSQQSAGPGPSAEPCTPLPQDGHARSGSTENTASPLYSIREHYVMDYGGICPGYGSPFMTLPPIHPFPNVFQAPYSGYPMPYGHPPNVSYPFPYVLPGNYYSPYGTASFTSPALANRAALSRYMEHYGSQSLTMNRGWPSPAYQAEPPQEGNWQRQGLTDPNPSPIPAWDSWPLPPSCQTQREGECQLHRI
ncbi:transcription factor SOX-30-like [Hyperolius riggenbachi]|uniref:transcription factor SOX-30-like n=1 Tax=Hyperolius riggenbachi TaxID=752182 RepID=UPI0035A2B72E